jgi:hypothetical protein
MEVKSVNREGLTTVNDIHRERAWLNLITRAMGKALATPQQFAGTLGISPQLLSMQLSAVENKHFSFRRLCRTSGAFMAELLLGIIDFYRGDAEFEAVFGRAGAVGQLSAADQADLELGRTVRESLERRLAR